MGEYNIGKCKQCGHDIPEGGYICPNCELDQRNFFVRNKALTVIMILVIIAAIYFIKNPPKRFQKKAVPEEALKTIKELMRA